MKSWFVQAGDGATTLELREVAVPDPGPGQVLVRIRAAGLNRGEFLAAHGLHSTSTGGKAAGMEAAGEIVSVGPGVAGLKPGERVMGRCGGAFSGHALMDVREAVPMPAGLSWEEAAAIPITFTVVHDMLIAQGQLEKGEWLLITGVSSGVGVASLQAGKALGAKVIGTSGSAAKLEKLKAHGLDLGLCTRSGDFHDAVMQATGGHGVDLVVNNVGGSVFAECVRTLAFEGRLATVGYVDGVLKAEIDINALHSRRLKLFGVSNKLRNADQRATSARGFVSDLLPAIADKRIRPLIERAFPFAELPAAKALMESNAHLGKIVIRAPA
ncbi:MAG: zinc-binding dehydrogenase [Betaproteobacteria bacterium]|nr:zinc-binding dehydrogenase [Betaproteobacteria bacterium]